MKNRRKIILNGNGVRKLIGNGVRKNFLNLNVAHIGAKKRFSHVLRRICQGKCVFNLNQSDVSPEKKIFFNRFVPFYTMVVSPSMF